MLRAYLADHTPDMVCFAAAGIDGGMRAILESGKNIRVLAVDGTEAVLRYMEEGRIAATVTQEPFAQGDEAGVCCSTISTPDGGPPPAWCIPTTVCVCGTRSKFVIRSAQADDDLTF